MSVEDWVRSTLGNHVTLNGGFAFPDRFQGATSGELPFYKVSDMSLPGNERWLTQANNYVSTTLALRQGWKSAPPEGVAFAKVGAALLLNRRRVLTTESLVDNNMMVAVARNDLDNRWLYWWLQRVDFGIFVQPGALPSVNQEQLSGLPLHLPPLPQQRRIAKILDSLDEAILKSEQVIAKLQEMKQGLLHDLLTRGIDENGELRDPERHPEQFKDSPLGRVPRDWEVVALGEVVPAAEYGVSVPLSDRGTVPVLRMMNFSEGEADLADLRYSDDPALGRLLLRPGDVLFNRTNSIDHVGRTGIWRGQLPVVSFASYLVRLVPDSFRITSEFLNRWLNWESTQIRIRRWATPGVSQVNINPTNLRRTTLALPKVLTEQEAITATLLQHDAQVKAVRTEVAKLRTLKHGLMDDLLTGRVRVPLDEPAR